MKSVAPVAPNTVGNLALVREGRKAPAKRINFTIQGIGALRPPTDRDRFYVFDERTPALAVCVTKTGAKSFYIYRRINGRPERVRLGSFPQMTIEQARKRAGQVQGDIADGKDPAAERRVARQEMTVGILWADYLERHAKIKKRTWRGDEYRYKKHLAEWENRKLSHTRRTDVRALVNKIGGGESGKPYEANRVLALVRAMFNYAATIDWKGDNPAIGIEPFPEASRERYLTADEMPKFWVALEDHPSPDFRDFVRLAIFTGARRSNVLGMRWQDIDETRKLWTIPADDSKNAAPMHIPLVAGALDAIAHRRTTSTTSEWVFPSWGKSGHIREMKRAWRDFINAAGLKDLRIHDLRRTAGSWQAATGAPLQVIGKSLGHKSQSATAVYARINLDPVRAALEAATDAMLKASKPKAQRKAGGNG